MPEGDDIHHHARQLRARLVGQRLRRVWLRAGGAAAIRGRPVDAVHAIGKHLIIELSAEPGLPDALRVHLGLHGGWRMLPAGRVPRRLAHRTALRLGTDREELLCLGAKQVELGILARMRQAGALSRLGPDLLGAAPDLHAIARSARQARPLGDVLLDQEIAAGIGNVYKAELCFWARRAPSTPADGLSVAELEAIYTQARTWLEANVGPWTRVTTGPPPLPPQQHGARTFVYGRRGRPCLRCGDRIVSARQGSPQRVTYRCPTCQPEPRSASDPQDGG